jgi:hypothetical protein
LGVGDVGWIALIIPTAVLETDRRLTVSSERIAWPQPLNAPGPLTM